MTWIIWLVIGLAIGWNIPAPGFATKIWDKILGRITTVVKKNVATSVTSELNTVVGDITNKQPAVAPTPTVVTTPIVNPTVKSARPDWVDLDNK